VNFLGVETYQFQKRNQNSALSEIQNEETSFQSLLRLQKKKKAGDKKH